MTSWIGRVIMVCCGFVASTTASTQPAFAPATMTLDGPDWLLATDSQNVGKDQSWWIKARADAAITRVPWIIQDRFPGYHGVAWYWKPFIAPTHTNPEGRSLLRFWSVSYKAEVWLNGIYLGSNEGTEVPFVLDATTALRPGVSNLLAVRVVDPAEAGTDGLLRGQIPGGRVFNHGGIEDSVELLFRPAVYLSDVHVQPDPATGKIAIDATVHNSLTNKVTAELEFSVTPAATHRMITRQLPKGETVIHGELQITNTRRWDLHDPFLYQVRARVNVKNSNSFDEQTIRTGFRDFRIENGHFRLNGRRIYLRTAHTGQQDPFGLRVPFDPDWPLADLRMMKEIGFNSIRFFQSLGLRKQLDLADELGFLIYEEPRGGWLIDYAPNIYEQRRNRSIRAMIQRDRNHPSVVAWGLLNESPADLSKNHPTFIHARKSLALIRSMDPNRLAILSSGRWDGQPDIGSVANPGVSSWQHLLGNEAKGAAAIKPLCQAGGVWPSPPALPIAGYVGAMGDVHVYPRVPHTAPILQFLRTVGQGTKNIFVSEYGIASAVDLGRMCDLYSKYGFAHTENAQNFRKRLGLFMADWERWRMAECFGKPSKYFNACYRSNARQRLDGINALRANPHVAGYSLTATIDTANAGEGVFNLFREVKPGMSEALTDAFAPLRWCLFAEPRNIYRGEEITLEAVLANEDSLPTGPYPTKIEVIGPKRKIMFSKEVTLNVPAGVEPPLAVETFAQRMKADWPPGKYLLRATFADGRKVAGQEVEFHVDAVTAMPPVTQTVWVWGDDPELVAWLKNRGIPAQLFTTESALQAKLILASRRVPAPGDKAAFDALMKLVDDGAQVLFLEPEVFADDKSPTALVPLKNKGTATNPFDTSCFYAKDEWAKAHPIFAGMPAGGVLDFNFYRELLSDQLWEGQDTPAETVAGAIATSSGYFAGLRMAIYERGRGRWVLNTYALRENLGVHPAAERILRNTLRYLSEKPGRTLHP